MIAGAVGSGKSSLLSALLGEMQPEKASAVASAVAPRASLGEGRVGYFSQTAFILNDTLRGNILLGAPMDEEWYERTLQACALLPDLKVLPGGDMTQVRATGWKG